MIYEGNFAPLPGRFAIVAAKFNSEIVERLVAGAKDALRKHGVPEDAVDLAWVPGAFELPLVAKRLAHQTVLGKMQIRSGESSIPTLTKYAAVICLGAVIRGDTDHYDHVCRAAADGILQAGLETGVPVLFGVLT